MTYKKSLEVLCDTIIQNASPHRGRPQHKERREEMRPWYMPLFFHEVVLAKLRTEKDEVTEDECRKLLVGLMLKILDEASERCPQIPIYFETALLLIWRHKINDAEEWLRQTGIRLKTGDILQRYIAKALEALQKTHASI